MPASPATLNANQMSFPNGTAVPNLDAHREDGNWPISDTGQMITAPGWHFDKPVRGMWTVTLTKKVPAALVCVLFAQARAAQDGSAFPALERRATGHPDAYLFVWNESPYLMFSHLGTYAWTLNSTVGVTAQLYNTKQNAGLARGARCEEERRARALWASPTCADPCRLLRPPSCSPPRSTCTCQMAPRPRWTCAMTAATLTRWHTTECEWSVVVGRFFSNTRQLRGVVCAA